MLKIVSFKICPFVQRVTAALEAREIPYEIEYISLKDKPQWFLDISPNGQVPVMVTESGTALFESDAIVEYIEDEYGAIEKDVSNEQRALDRAWGYLGSKNYLVQCGTMRSKDEATFNEKNEKLMAAFKKVEIKLPTGAKFFKGGSLSNVDFAWLPMLHRTAIIEAHTGFDFFSELPKVKAWQKAIMESGLVETSVSEDFEERFTGFYLDGTYLSWCKAESACCNKASCC